MRIAMAQIDLRVGDIEGNVARIRDAAEKAVAAGATMLVVPELALTGYPPEDLLGKPHFVGRSIAALIELATDLPLDTVVGFVDRDSAGYRYNAAALISGGTVRQVYRKHDLPNYGVFDEVRYFEPGTAVELVSLDGAAAALTICEDIWNPETVDGAVAAGARVIINISASPFHMGKGQQREQMLRQRAVENHVWIVYCNLVGGQDELVFDGRSVLIAPSGAVVARALSFAEDLLVVDIDPASSDAPTQRVEPLVEREEELHAALTLGLRDYIGKNGFSDVVIGLSGGIDSALTAVIAADALGPEHVHGVLMPSRYSSEGSLTDARELADRLGISTMALPIEDAFGAMLQTLEPPFDGLPADVTEENLQARVRGTLLMALSNKFGWLVLATGNKSELSVGYSTLYGDMVGGFAPLKDVFKTSVWALSRWRNTLGAVIPESSIIKPPSAELRSGQTDEDSLPPYGVLDAILKSYVELDRSKGEIAAEGNDFDLVGRVIRMVDIAEYKRRQGPLGIKVTPKAFGKDRRMPITNGFRS